MDFGGSQRKEVRGSRLKSIWSLVELKGSRSISVEEYIENSGRLWKSIEAGRHTGRLWTYIEAIGSL